jgi:4'-phosphopantetheinyl transferase
MELVRSSRINSPPLGADEVCVWHASLDKINWDSGEVDRLLSADERKKAERFVFELDQKRYRIGHAVLKMILASYLALEPEQISFQHNQYGKPILEGSGLFFNMSKSAGRAVFALTRNRNIGVDIEYIRDIPQMDQIAQRLFSKHEYELFCTYPENVKKKSFFDSWTRKEALVKAIGAGLSFPLHSFDVLKSHGEALHIVRSTKDSEKDRQWAIYDLRQDTGYTAAVAVECPCSLPPQIYVFPSSSS